jgi:hypothetical protein
MAMQKFKCPICGYRFLADPEGMYTSGQVSVIRNAQTPGGVPAPGTPATIDLTCPNGGHEFEVVVRP